MGRAQWIHEHGRRPYSQRGLCTISSLATWGATASAISAALALHTAAGVTTSAVPGHEANSPSRTAVSRPYV